LQTSVSNKRLKEFLISDELDPGSVTLDPNVKNSVEVNQGTFSWDRSFGPVLKDIDLCVKPGELTAIVGM
jgi:ABC-type bacteriocin/lantibiotic exporter with double-glycine peptidase domain